MTDVQELRAAQAALREGERTLGEYHNLLEDWTAKLEDPEAAGLSPVTQDTLEKSTENVRQMIEFQSARVERLQDAVLTLEVQQPEYPQYAAAWLSYGHLRQAHVDLIGVGEAPPDGVGDEADERALGEWLELPFMSDYTDWAKTVRYPKGALDLSTWPHTLPDPPDEPHDAEERLRALLNDPDAVVRTFGYMALTVLAEARAVRDYKGQRTLS